MAIPQSTVAPLRNRNARDVSNIQRLPLVLRDRSSPSWIDTVRLLLSPERALQDVSTSKGNTFGFERKLPRFQREDLERGVGSLDTRRQPRGFNVIVLDLQDGNRDNPSENHFAGEQKQRRDPKAMHRRILSLVLCLCITCAASQSTEDQQRLSRFIRVSDSYFTLGNRKFYFTGTNCYYVLTYSVEEDTRQEVLDVFDGMEELGLTVLRMWAFNDGDRWNALQPEPGVYSRRVFRGLDWAVTEAGSRGIKLVMTLTNYFPDYGGMLQYVNWTTGSGDVNDFYSNSECKTLYKRFVRRVLNRRNSLTGVQYKDDPTIMAWELANEARYTSRPGGIAMRNWVREMSRHIKNIDPNHLVTTGSEGFFGEGELSSANPAPFFNEVGVVTELQHRVDEIDYISAHIWPTQWLPEGNLRQRRQFAAQWIRAQARLGTALEKPVVFGEFGYQPDGNPRRNFYTTVYNVIYTLASRGRPVAGSNFWMISSPSYPDFDGYTVYPDLDRRSRQAPDNTTLTTDLCWRCCLTDGQHCSACDDEEGGSTHGKLKSALLRAKQKFPALQHLSLASAIFCAKHPSHSRLCESIPTEVVAGVDEICSRSPREFTRPGVLRQIRENAENMNALNVRV